MYAPISWQKKEAKGITQLVSGTENLMPFLRHYWELRNCFPQAGDERGTEIRV